MKKRKPKPQLATGGPICGRFQARPTNASHSTFSLMVVRVVSKIRTQDNMSVVIPKILMITSRMHRNDVIELHDDGGGGLPTDRNYPFWRPHLEDPRRRSAAGAAGENPEVECAI